MEANENVGQCAKKYPSFCGPSCGWKAKIAMGKFIGRVAWQNGEKGGPYHQQSPTNWHRSFTSSSSIKSEPSNLHTNSLQNQLQQQQQMESSDDECTKGFLQGEELKQLGEELSLADQFMGLISKDELMSSGEKKTAKSDKIEGHKSEEKAAKDEEDIQFLGGKKKQPSKFKQSKLKLEPKKKAKKNGGQMKVVDPVKEKPKQDEDSEDSEPVSSKKKAAKKPAKDDESDLDKPAKKKKVVAKKAKEDDSDSDRPAKKKVVAKRAKEDESDSDRPAKKKVVAKKAKADGGSDDSGWEPDWDSDDDDGKEEDDEEQSDDGDESDDGNEDAGGKKGKFDWIFKSNRIIQTFGQCSDCIEMQKGLDPVVIQNRHGLFVRLVQCRKCFSANGRIRQTQDGFLERGKSFDFFEEVDDYKTAATIYVKAIGQCQYCRNKMGRLDDDKMVEKLGKSHICLHLAQCSTCVARNKQLQRMYWDAFSSLYKGGKKGGTSAGGTGGKKRKFKRVEDDEDEEDEQDDMMPAKKKSKKMMKK